MTTVESIGCLVDKLSVENLKIYNIREQLHQEGLSDEQYVELNNKMNLLNHNRAILSNLLDEKVEAVVVAKEKNVVLANVKTYSTQQTTEEKWRNSIDVKVKEEKEDFNYLLNTVDAREWTKAWLKITKTNPEISKDEGTMLGWFSNAIMTGYDEANRRRDVEDSEQTFKICSPDYLWKCVHCGHWNNGNKEDEQLAIVKCEKCNAIRSKDLCK